MKNFNPNLYITLGVLKQNATPQEIKKAYKTSAKTYHPDKNIDNIDHAKNMMIKVNEAYEILSDPIKREEYDKRLLQYQKDIDKQQEKITKDQNEKDVSEYFNFKVQIVSFLLFVLATIAVVSLLKNNNSSTE